MNRFQAQGGICYASVDYLAAELGAGARTIDRWLKALVTAGYIRRTYISGFRTKVTVFLEHPKFAAKISTGPVEIFPRETPQVADQVRQKWRIPSLLSESEDLEGKGLETNPQHSASTVEPAVEIPAQIALFHEHTPAEPAKMRPAPSVKMPVLAAQHGRQDVYRWFPPSLPRSTARDALKRVGMRLIKPQQASTDSSLRPP
jgi:Helix-turn-helix domain